MPKIPDQILDLAKRQHAELLGLERDKLAALRKALAEVGPELLTRINAGGGPASWLHEPTQAALLRALVAVVQGSSSATLEDVLETSLAESFDMAPEHATREIDNWLDYFGAEARPIDVATVSELADQGALLERSRSSVERFGAAVARRVRSDISAGIILRDTPGDVIKGVQKSINAERWRAERIVRTELSNAYNSAHLETLKHVKESGQVPNLKKSAIVTFDHRTAADSPPMHGQVRELDEMFRDGAGRRFLHPPGRPNDREKEIPWFDDEPESPISLAPLTEEEEAAKALEKTREQERSARRFADDWSAGSGGQTARLWSANAPDAFGLDGTFVLQPAPESAATQSDMVAAWEATQRDLQERGLSRVLVSRPLPPGVLSDVSAPLEGWTSDQERALRLGGGDAIEELVDARRVVLAPDGPSGGALQSRGEYVVLPQIPRRRWRAEQVDTGAFNANPDDTQERAGPFALISGDKESTLYHAPSGRVLLSGRWRAEDMREVAHKLEVSDLVNARGELPGANELKLFDLRVQGIARDVVKSRRASGRALSWREADFEIGFFDASELDKKAERSGPWGILEERPTEANPEGGASLYHVPSGREILRGSHTKNDLRRLAQRIDPLLLDDDELPDEADPLFGDVEEEIDSTARYARRKRVSGLPWTDNNASRFVDLGGADFPAINDDVDTGAAETWSRRTFRTVSPAPGGAYEVQEFKGYVRGNFAAYKTRSSYESANGRESADWHLVHLRTGVELHNGTAMVVTEGGGSGDHAIPLGGWRLGKFKDRAEALERFLDKDGHVKPSMRNAWLDAIEGLNRETSPGKDVKEFINPRQYSADDWRTSPILAETAPRYISSTRQQLAPSQEERVEWWEDGPDSGALDNAKRWDVISDAFGDDDVPF